MRCQARWRVGPRALLLPLCGLSWASACAHHVKGPGGAAPGRRNHASWEAGELGGGIPWALEVQGTLVGLASRHPPEERVVEAAASDLDTLVGTHWQHPSVLPSTAVHSCHQHCSYRDGQLLPPLLAPLGQGWGQVYFCPLRPPAQGQPRMVSAGVCGRSGWAGEGEGIRPSVGNHLVSTFCGPGRQGPCSMGQRRLRAKKSPEKYIAA